MDTAAIFVTNRGFLVPSLVAARQLRSFGIHKIADILLFLIDDDPEFIKRVTRDFGNEVTVVPLNDRSYVPSDLSEYAHTHVPVESLARLVIGEFLDPGYKNIVYLDGDIQVLADPTPLFSTPVPEGKIAAAPGQDWLRALSGEKQFDDLDKHGLDAETYFNSGVFAVSADTWREMGPKALQLKLADPENYMLSDQTVMNVVFAGNILPLSVLYNFQGWLARTGVLGHVEPKIVHFSGSEYKPWSRFPAPWFGRFRGEYARFLKRYPYLAETLPLSTRWARAEFSARRQVFRDKRNPALQKRWAIWKQAVIDRVERGSFID